MKFPFWIFYFGYQCFFCLISGPQIIEGATLQKKPAENSMSLAIIDKRKPFLESVKIGNFQKVKEFLTKDVDINMKDVLGRTPLHYAARLGYFEIVKFLFSSGANICERDSDGFTPLLRGIQSRNMETVEFLISKGADINIKAKNGHHASNLAAGNGDSEMIEYIRILLQK